MQLYTCITVARPKRTQPFDVGVEQHDGLLDVPHVLVDVVEEGSVGDGSQTAVHAHH